MSLDLSRFSYTRGAALVRDPQDRREAARPLFEAAGCKLHGFHLLEEWEVAGRRRAGGAQAKGSSAVLRLRPGTQIRRTATPASR
jgi:hypothetical protein